MNTVGCSTREPARWRSGPQADTGIDGENLVDSTSWTSSPSNRSRRTLYQDIADFAQGISDGAAGQRLARALQGRGAFRRFKNELHEHHPELISPWHTLRDARAQRRAVEWLLNQGLIDDSATERFTADHPDPELP